MRKAISRKLQVVVDDPHLKSGAALLLLTQKLMDAKEKEIIEEWLKFRLDFLSGYKTLTCTHCGKTDLQIETDDEDKLATVDHVLPLSQGGDKYDTKNCIVSCYPCNNNRGDLSVSEYRRRKESAKKKRERRDPRDVLKGFGG